MANHQTLSCVNHLQNNTYYNTRDIIHAPDKLMIPDAGFVSDTFTPDARTPMQLPPIHPRYIQHKPSSEFAIKRQREELRLELFLALRKRCNAVVFLNVRSSACLRLEMFNAVLQQYCQQSRPHLSSTCLLGSGFAELAASMDFSTRNLASGRRSCEARRLHCGAFK